MIYLFHVRLTIGFHGPTKSKPHFLNGLCERIGWWGIRAHLVGRDRIVDRLRDHLSILSATIICSAKLYGSSHRLHSGLPRFHNVPLGGWHLSRISEWLGAIFCPCLCDVTCRIRGGSFDFGRPTTSLRQGTIIRVED